MVSAPASLPPFAQQLGKPLTKLPITVLQINLGRRCNLACQHCHVEAGPNRREELSPEVCDQLMAIIQRFPQLQTVDLTGGAPEINYGFRPLVETARRAGKQVMVRTNLTIFFEPGHGDLPDYFARHQVHVIASLPCYLEDNVDRQRGSGTYNASIQALQWLNRLGYGHDPQLPLDLVYNPALPQGEEFSLAPNQDALTLDYRRYLQEHFGIVFNQLYTLTNLPIGRIQQHLEHRQLYWPYLSFLAQHHNPATVPKLMCRSQISVDYRGYLYDCDFNQMAGVNAVDGRQQPLTLGDLLAANSLEMVSLVQTRPCCYGCTAGSGSSCGGALV